MNSSIWQWGSFGPISAEPTPVAANNFYNPSTMCRAPDFWYLQKTAADLPGPGGQQCSPWHHTVLMGVLAAELGVKRNLRISMVLDIWVVRGMSGQSRSFGNGGNPYSQPITNDSVYLCKICFRLTELTRHWGQQNTLFHASLHT